MVLSVEDILFYILLNCRNFFFFLVMFIFISSFRFLLVLKGGVVGGVGSSYNIILLVFVSVFNEY